MNKYIMTNYIYPPIPYRNMDWCAYWDGEEEDGKCGYGPTEREAIEDLIDNDESEWWMEILE